MNHADALREMSVEKYLLGELTGPSRDDFEDHLFECGECAADLKSAVVFIQAARQELRAPEAESARARETKPGWFDWLLRPQWMVPALAACLALLGYLTLFRIPELKNEVARVETPRIVDNLVLAGGALRGGGPQHVVAPKSGAFLLSVDLPPQQSGYSSFVFSLFSPTGAMVWKASVPMTQATDTVQISVPEASTQPGENTLLVQGTRGNAPSGATLEDLARHKFTLEVQN